MFWLMSLCQKVQRKKIYGHATAILTKLVNKWNLKIMTLRYHLLGPYFDN